MAAFSAGLGRGPFRSLLAPCGLRGPAWVVLLAVGISGSSCALFEDEDSLPPSPTIVAVTPTTTSTTTPSTTAATAATVLSETTTTSAAATTTTLSVGREIRYLEQLLSAGAGWAELAESVKAGNDDWDDRSRTNASFSDIEATLEAVSERAGTLAASFGLIEPPSELGLEEEHRTAAAAVNIMVEASRDMLDGLRSTDTGQARRAAVVGFLTAHDLWREAIERVAASIGAEGEALPAADRSFPVPPDTTVPEALPAATDAPPNPGNTRNCSDFSTQEEAQEWFDTYFPLYGDVAQIDTNANRVACESLLEDPRDPG